MSDGTYQRTKRVNGQLIVRPVFAHGVMAFPNKTVYDPRDDGWRRLTKGRDGKLYENARNRPCPCGSGKRFKRCCRDSLRAQGMSAGATFTGTKP